MEKDIIAVAIDGPAAAGKSTIAKKVANALGFTYIDTGAMYRAVTAAVIEAGLDPRNEEQSSSLLPNMNIDLMEDGRVLYNGRDVTKEIREKAVSDNVSYIAAMKPIRLALVDMQRDLAKKKSVIMDGRDIGTYVLPDADVKIFQVASVDERAQRRYLENIDKGMDTSYEEVLENLKNRDLIDSSRAFAPLKPANDSILLDTSDMSIDEVTDAVLAIIKEKTGVEAKTCR